MRLSKPLRTLVGALIGVYLLLSTASVGVFAAYFITVMGQPADAVPGQPELLLFGFVAANGLLQLGLIVFIFAHLIVSITKAERTIDVLQVASGLGTLVMPFIAVPLYFFAYVWPEQPPEWAVGTPIILKKGEPTAG